MTHDKIVDQVITLLRSQDKHGGHFHQEPYKGDFFRLFVLANERGAGLKADRLHHLIAERAPELFEGKNWPLLYAAWPEWDYVWSRAKRLASLDDDRPGGCGSEARLRTSIEATADGPSPTLGSPLVSRNLFG